VDDPSRYRLLIVEDSPSDAMLLRAELEEGPLAGAALEHASTLDAALARLAADRYDAVLTDLGLPDSDGFATFDAIVAAARDAAVVVLTGRDDEQLADEAVVHGAQDYLVKGHRRPGDLARAVRYSVRRQQLLTELRVARDEQLAQKDNFLSHVSHELRCPLAVVHQFASLLADGIAGELQSEQLDLLTVIIGNVEQLKAMIDDLLLTSRADRGAVVIETDTVEPAPLLAETAAAFRPAAAELGLTLIHERQPLPPVVADPTRVREILTNLVDNALKFTPRDGRVTVGAAAEGDFVRFVVRDTGCGIDADALPHVFDRFFQAEQSDSISRNGLGLGLFVCRDLVRRQGGELTAASEPGAGTTMSFTLPLARLGKAMT
jgi:signal transduction histidine kinase